MRSALGHLLAVVALAEPQWLTAVGVVVSNVLIVSTALAWRHRRLSFRIEPSTERRLP